MNFIKELTNVQYGDYEGFASVDSHSGNDLFFLCQKKGINLDTYFPVGYHIGENTTAGISSKNELDVTVYLIEKCIAGDNYDQIEKFIKKNSGKIELIRKSFTVEFSELNEYIKRYNITIFSQLRDVIKDVEITDDEN